MTEPEYFGRHEFAALKRSDDGILEVVLHTHGDSLVWGIAEHHGLPELFEAIGNDPANEVVILTGTGASFIAQLNFGQRGKMSPSYGGRLQREGRRMLHALLDIDAPLIAAVNGPARIHPELALLCDIVLAAPTACFQDAPHFPAGLIPGDGAHVIWPALLGINRGRYFLLTGEEISAEEALRWGIVQEVLPEGALLERAHHLAKVLLEAPPLARRFTSSAIRSQIRHLMYRDLAPGLAIEGMASLEFWPSGVVGLGSTGPDAGEPDAVPSPRP
jgi:enoyl-CoA hydratase/carnithine racemase